MLDANSWQGVKVEVLKRISSRQWQPGELIPGETALATQLGCSRVTVNRALRSLADEGLLERRRKAGTRVVRNPVAKATVEAPGVRAEVITRGHVYSFDVLVMRKIQPSRPMQEEFGLAIDTPLLGLWTLHKADNLPFCYEERWLNLTQINDRDLDDVETLGAEDYLARHLLLALPHHKMSFGAVTANSSHAHLLKCDKGEALLTRVQTIWTGDIAVSSARFVHAPGHVVETVSRSAT